MSFVRQINPVQYGAICTYYHVIICILYTVDIVIDYSCAHVVLSIVIHVAYILLRITGK